jgi:hypothetical protein
MRARRANTQAQHTEAATTPLWWLMHQTGDESDGAVLAADGVTAADVRAGEGKLNLPAAFGWRRPAAVSQPCANRWMACAGRVKTHAQLVEQLRFREVLIDTTFEALYQPRRLPL